MNTETLEMLPANDSTITRSVADRWIRSRFSEVTGEVQQHLRTYRLDLALQTAYDFTWHEFCDWYLELSKSVLQSDEASDAQKHGTRQTLIEMLESTLRLLHPLMPFVTEEIWQSVKQRAQIDGETIMLQPFPNSSDVDLDPDAVADIQWVQQFILGIRQIRGEMDISPGKSLNVLLQDATPRDLERAAMHAGLLQRVGRVETVSELSANDVAPAAATALLGDMRLLVPMKGLIDVAAERARLLKQRDKVDAELGKSRAKLTNESFVNNAPAAVVEQEKQRVKDFGRTIEQLNEQLEKLDLLDD